MHFFKYRTNSTFRVSSSQPEQRAIYAYQCSIQLETRPLGHAPTPTWLPQGPSRGLLLKPPVGHKFDSAEPAASTLGDPSERNYPWTF